MKQTINIYDMFLVETSLWWLILCGRLIFQVPFPTISNCESMAFFYLSQYTGFIIWSFAPFTFSQILQSQARFRHEMLTTFLVYFSDVLICRHLNDRHFTENLPSLCLLPNKTFLPILFSLHTLAAFAWPQAMHYITPA